MNNLIGMLFGLKKPVNYLPMMARLLLMLGALISLINQVEDQDWKTFLIFIVALFLLYDVAKVHFNVLQSIDEDESL